MRRYLFILQKITISRLKLCQGTKRLSFCPFLLYYSHIALVYIKQYSCC